MSMPDDEFDDPTLRSAVRRACTGPGTAPPALRRRVEVLLVGSTGAAEVTTRPRRGWPVWMGASPARTLAAAAACFLAVGVAVVQIWATFGPQPGPTPVARVSFPVSAAVEMIRTHDNCARLPDHHLVPGNDPT